MHTQAHIKGQIYCPASRRIEGTVHNEGKRCSFCRKDVSERA